MLCVVVLQASPVRVPKCVCGIPGWTLDTRQPTVTTLSHSRRNWPASRIRRRRISGWPASGRLRSCRLPLHECCWLRRPGRCIFLRGCTAATGRVHCACVSATTDSGEDAMRAGQSLGL